MTFSSILSYIAALFSIGLAVLVFVRDRKAFVHRIFASGMILLAIEAVIGEIGSKAILADGVLYWNRVRLICAAIIPGIWLLFALAYSRINYKEIIFKWRWVVSATFIIPIGLVTVFWGHFFKGEPFLNSSSAWLIPLGWSGYVYYLFFLLGAVLILMNLERTLRTSAGRIRWQIKFMVLGLGSLFGVRVYVVSQVVLFRSLMLNIEVLNVVALVAASILFLISFSRARSFNVNFYLSQSFLYNSFAVLFVGIYLLSVGILAKVATYFTGHPGILFNAFLIFFALLVLIAILLSARLRMLLKRLISRHFNRPLYDYRKEWIKFTHETSDVTETKTLCSIVTGMISKTFDTLSVSIWLVDEDQGCIALGGSTVISERQPQELESLELPVKEMIRVMRDEKLPFDYDYSQEAWKTGMIRSNGDVFRQTRIRYCLPMIAGEKCLGVITLGDEVRREHFSVEDFDLLKTIADQTAGNLLNLKLSADLQRAKEMEAFQSISAFVVHDLKNLASKLSLTMENLPVHFDNPDFRSDALQTISQSLNKINTMCGRLSSLSRKLVLHRTEADLNELVKRTLSGLDGLLKTSPNIDLHPIPRLLVDQEQIQNVLTNLVLNANEAINNDGEMKVSTVQQDGFVVLLIRDNGCGMSQEFIEKSLFRPFQTTKKQGMGIGLFQSKMIVEAHQGRIEVESEEGRGTTFRVFLPVAGK